MDKILTILIAGIVSQVVLAGEEPAVLIHRWEFNPERLARFQKITDPARASLEIVDGQVLKFTHHRGPVICGTYEAGVKVALPEHFIFRVNLVGQKVMDGNFSLKLRGERKQGACIWEVRIPKETTEASVVNLFCQAPPGVAGISLYLNPSGPAVEGELLLRSVEIVKPPVPPARPELPQWSIIRNSGFEQTWPYPGNLNDGWVISDGVKHLSGDDAVGGKRYIEINKGYLRQMLSFHFPQKYLITFYARVLGRLALLVRENDGASIDILSLKPDLWETPNTADAGARKEVAETGLIWEECPGKTGWKKFYAVYPVLQDGTPSGYIQFSGENALLDEVEIYPLCLDPQRLEKPVRETRAELKRLLASHPLDQLANDARAFEAASRAFDARGGLYPDDYLRQITQMLLRVKLELIFN